jgi:magnesium transporter
MENEKNPLPKHSGIDWISNDKLVWINIEKPTREKMKILGSNYSFHELNLEDCLSKIQIPKVDHYGDHLFIILHFPAVENNESIPRSSQLSIFIGYNYLVTIHQGNLRPLVDTFQICKNNQNQRETFMGKSSGYLFHSIIDILVDDLLHILIKVKGNLDDIEDVVFDERIAIAKEISLLRREITILKRLVYPLKRTLLTITREIQKFSDEDLSLYFDDVLDHIDKVIEVLDESKDTIEIFKDTDFMLSAEKTNKILAILTIFFTLSIPATIFATFYGMNINLPGGIETGAATFLGPYTSFIIIIILSIIPPVFMLYWFKIKGWLVF